MVDAKDLIRGAFARAQMVSDMLLEDLDESEIMMRPAEHANHIAWQLGHLIVSFNMFGNKVRADSMPALPEGFVEQHSKETSASDDASGFLSKGEYLDLLNQNREGLVGLVAEADLDAAAPEEMQGYCQSVGDMLDLAASHELMHSGQITVLRRRLGKPIKF